MNRAGPSDGNYIYIDTTADKPAIYRIGLHGRKVEKVVSLETFPRAQDFGNWLGLAPDDRFCFSEMQGNSNFIRWM